VADKVRDVVLEITTDFLHKLPVVNCGLVRTEVNGSGERVQMQIGIILQGLSFGRCAWSEKASTSKLVYDALRDVGWFDDETFLLPGLSLMKGKKEYKKYETDKYSFAYQDIAIECDRFDYLSGLVLQEVEKAVVMLENGELDGYFAPTP